MTDIGQLFLIIVKFGGKKIINNLYTVKIINSIFLLEICK